MYIIVNTGIGNSIPLSAHLLGCIFIARVAGVEQRRMQRFLVSVNMLPPPCWRHSQQLQTAPGRGEVKMPSCLRRNYSSCWERGARKEEPGGSGSRDQRHRVPSPQRDCLATESAVMLVLLPAAQPKGASSSQASVEMQMHLEPGVCGSLWAREAGSLDFTRDPEPLGEIKTQF